MSESLEDEAISDEELANGSGEMEERRNWKEIDTELLALVGGLYSADESIQLTAVEELSSSLLMANENTLSAGFPARKILIGLIGLLNKEHNAELMLMGVRCLRHLLEAWPRTHTIAGEAVPFLLNKLLSIEYIDVAEQALYALEELSKRSNAKVILLSGGIRACISHIDFFPLSSQRLAISLATNCAQYLTSADFALVRDSLPELVEKLCMEDERCVESVCLFFCRIVDNLRNHPDKLREIAGTGRLVILVHKLLRAQPNQLSSIIFFSLIRLLTTLIRACPDLAVTLIQLDFPSTLRYLFTGSYQDDDILDRPVSQLQDMVALAAELFPRLPTSGVFEIDLFVYSSKANLLPIYWYWLDDNNKWTSYRSHDIRTLEYNKTNGMKDLNLQIGQTSYLIDFEKMVQINMATNKERRIKRVLTHTKVTKIDERQTLLQSDLALMEKTISSLAFPIVYIGGESSVMTLRLECMRALMRFLCPAPPFLLRNVLSSLPLSTNISSALSTSVDKDYSIVVTALQMVNILLEKVPDIYCPLFHKEGVAHEIAKLAYGSNLVKALPPSTPTTTPPPPSNSTPQSTGIVTRSQRAKQEATTTEREKDKENGNEDEPIAMRTRKRSSPESSSSSSSKKKRTPRRKSSIAKRTQMEEKRNASEEVAAEPEPENDNQRNLIALQSADTPVSSRTPSTSNMPSTSSSTFTAPDTALTAVPSSLISTSHRSALLTQFADKVELWIKNEAESILKKFLSSASSDTVLTCLKWVGSELNKRDIDVGTTPLIKFYHLLKTENVSAFELIHSGVISALFAYLSSVDEHFLPHRLCRLRRFADIFIHLKPDNLRPSGVDFDVFALLVSKLLATVARLEQFQVVMNDIAGFVAGPNGSLSGLQALKFIHAHHLKIILRRHPDCQNLRVYQEGRNSMVAIDPFLTIAAIENFLLDNGIHLSEEEESTETVERSGEDDDSVKNQRSRVAVTEISSSSEDASTSGSRRSHSNAEANIGIEFIIGNTVLPRNMTILQILCQYSIPSTADPSTRSALLMSPHIMYYRSCTVLPPASTPVTPSSQLPPQPATTMSRKTKSSDKLWQEGILTQMQSPLWSYLSPSPASSDSSQLSDPSLPSLQLLRVLYGLNCYWFTLFENDNLLPTTFAPILPFSNFHSSKLSSKLSRQLSDFISIALQQLPKWIRELVNFVPFMFPFSLRRSFLYSTAFDGGRAIMHLVSQNDVGQGEGGNENSRMAAHRLKKRKLVVKRDELLRTSEVVLAENASSRVMLEVSFEGETGTGYGPTLEFYTAVSKELQHAALNIWHSKETIIDDQEEDEKEYVVAPFGLYPLARGHNTEVDTPREKLFEMLGRLMGQALVDCRILDLPLSTVFLQWLTSSSSVYLSLAQLEQLDPHLYSSLRNLSLTEEADFEHLEACFTMPGDDAFELLKGGKDKLVNKQNVMQFIKLVSHWRLYEGVNREMEAVRRGFSQVLSPSLLSIFFPHELDELFCGSSDFSDKTWNEDAIRHALKPDQGYTHNSEHLKWLISILASFRGERQRNFVQFVTGSPRLPVGGLRALRPLLTVARKLSDWADIDFELPSAMTCYNYLKLPPYSSKEVMETRLLTAISYNKGFFLS